MLFDEIFLSAGSFSKDKRARQFYGGLKMRFWVGPNPNKIIDQKRRSWRHVPSPPSQHNMTKPTKQQNEREWKRKNLQARDHSPCFFLGVSLEQQQKDCVPHFPYQNPSQTHLLWCPLHSFRCPLTASADFSSEYEVGQQALCFHQ